MLPLSTLFSGAHTHMNGTLHGGARVATSPGHIRRTTGSAPAHTHKIKGWRQYRKGGCASVRAVMDSAPLMHHPKLHIHHNNTDDMEAGTVSASKPAQ